MHLHVTAFPEDSVPRVQVMGRGIDVAKLMLLISQLLFCVYLEIYM